MNWDYRITVLPLALIGFFGFASAPEPISNLCAVMAFGLPAVVHGLLSIRYSQVRAMAGLLFSLALVALAATLIGMATNSYGWGFLTFLIGVPIAGFTLARLLRFRKQ